MFTTETNSHETETERSSLDMADSLKPNTRLVRLSMYVKRREGMNVDEFNDYWTNTHAPKVKQWLAKHGVVRYVQYHFHPSVMDSALATWPQMKQIPALEFDGVAEFLMPDVSCMKQAFETDYYRDVVSKDEEAFFERESVRWIVGWEETYIEPGKTLNGTSA